MLVCRCICVYVFMFKLEIDRERERESVKDREREREAGIHSACVGGCSCVNRCKNIRDNYLITLTTTFA